MNQLSNLIKIFNKKLLRVPDYQRGYAWQARTQLTDFWEDLLSLEEGKSHYTGVLTLEEVAEKTYKEWDDDLWLIENKGYKPFFIVDGQQRLTTCIILLQAIIEVALKLPENNEENNEDFELCDTAIRDIRREYIFQKKTGTILRSYIFGYEKDNPSYEFLKTKIFEETSSSNQNLETLYTLNLENAKKFFIENLLAFDEEVRFKELESIFKKVTRDLNFNEYVIQDDIDVFVAFETMNNRGKKLSDLELLKNRLIYLSTLYKTDEKEKIALRTQINDCWKEVYYQLGRSKTQPLNDDDFLKAHWTMYFKYSRKTGDDYINFLLTEQFSPKKVLKRYPILLGVLEPDEVRDENKFYESYLNSDENSRSFVAEVKYLTDLSIADVSDYALSLRAAVRHWYNSHNPLGNIDLTDDEQIWLDRLNRIGINYFRPLVMSALVAKTVDSASRVRLFKAIERFLFLAFRLSQVRANYRSSEFYNASRDLYFGKTTVDDLIRSLDKALEFTFNSDGSFKTSTFSEYINHKFWFSYDTHGFYEWSGLRYFLYEYETHLFEQSRNSTQKLTWNQFNNNKKDFVTIEHILPQNSYLDCWAENFEKYEWSEMKSLKHTLGNLLALSQPKNSSLQNKCYADKRANASSTHGYFNGSYSEIRVAEIYDDWTPEAIRDRGLEMLSFMESRWNINLGDNDTKLNLLHLSFLNS